MSVQNIPEKGRQGERVTLDDNHQPRSRAAATFAARVTLEDVGRTYDDDIVLEGINFDVKPGEIVSLLGPSGSGKTTILRLIAGIERPTTGRILLDELEVAGPSAFVTPEARNVGLMFQDFALFPHLNVIDNVAFGLKTLSAGERYKAARAILERVGMAGFADAFPATLSGGQQQRVALARAIVPRPAVMLMDEPFSGLDVQLRDAMQAETLALLRETRATTLIVTHHPEEAMYLSDRIIVLRNGRVAQMGTTENLYQEPATLFVARLFSEFNESSGRVRDGFVTTPAGTFPASNLDDGTRAVVCIREHAISVVPADRAGSAAAGLPGRVRANKSLGDVTRVELAVEGFDMPVHVRLERHAAMETGSEVAVSFDQSGVLVFAADDNAGDSS